MKPLISITFALFISSLPLFAQDTGTTPQISEEARKHFVMGTTLFKDAKTPDDYSQVESEFKQASDFAPRWPDARYNLALAKEAAGDYSGALDDLKLYQQFKLSNDEARTVQDKIYSLDAKHEKAVKKFIKNIQGHGLNTMILMAIAIFSLELSRVIMEWSTFKPKPLRILVYALRFPTLKSRKIH